MGQLGESAVTPPGPPSADQTYEVTVDGQPQQVTLAELQRGYIGQATFTQRAQEIADFRRKSEAYDKFLADLQRDPTRMIERIADQMGVPRTPAPEAGDNSFEDGTGDPVLSAEVANLQAQLKSLRGQLDTQSQSTKIESELVQLERVHGDSFDRNAVIAYANANGINDPALAFKAMSFDGLTKPNPGTAPEGDPNPGSIDAADLRRQIDEKTAQLEKVTQGTPNGENNDSTDTAPPKTPAEALERVLARDYGTDLNSLVR